MRRTTGGRRLEPAVPLPTEPIDFSCSSSAAFVLKQERCAVLCVEVLVVTWRLFFNVVDGVTSSKFCLFTMSVNYDRVCRLCLSSRGELLPIFPTTSSGDSEPPVLASKIKDCVSVQISENDDLPTNVCRKCVDNVNNWHIFKAVCERTQNKLELLIKKDGSQLEEIKIKSEPLSDGAYDDGVVIDGSYLDNDGATGSAKVQPEGPPILASLGLTPRSDKKIDPRMDWHRVHAILDMIQDDDVIDSLQSIEECDVMQQSDHDSESECELQNEIDDTFIDFKNGYICKNKMLLSKAPKVPSTDINAKIKQASTLRKRKFEEPKNCMIPKQAWQLLFSDDLIELIVVSTNHRILKMGHSIASSTSAGEIKSLIGILYLHGIMRPTHQVNADLWNKEYGMPCIRNAMKYDRFKFLLQNICFENEEDESIIRFDIMKRMRKVFEIFAMNCRASFQISNSAVVDEIVVPVYGPCPFRYENNKKPLKCGLKMVLLVDPVNFYVNNLDVITDPYFGPEEVVKKIVQHLSGSGKTVIMDSWYTSLNLIEFLIKEYELYSIAAVHANDDLVPPVFLSSYRKKDSYLTGFLDESIQITSYINADNKCSNVVTNDPTFYKRGYTGAKHLTAVAAYKKSQSAVEVVDVLMHYYTTLQHTNDWTLSLFFTLLNIASVNAQVIWTSQNSSQLMKRRSFIRELGVSLIEYQDLMSPMFDISLRTQRSENRDQNKIFYKNRRRCRICVKTTKRDRRTKQHCIKCGTFICKEHTVCICIVCGS